MKFKNLTIVELRNRRDELRNQAHAINDKIEAENRDMTPEEKSEWEVLKRDLADVVRRIEVLAMSEDEEVRGEAARAYAEPAFVFAATRERTASGAKLREFFNSPDGPAKNKVGVRIELRDSITATGTAEAANAIPVLIKDFIEPLNKGLILNQLGITMKTGLSANVSYPIMPSFEANFLEEKAEVTDTIVSIDALKPKPRRISISIPLTDLANLQSDGLVYEWVLNNLAIAVSRTLNRWVFQPSAIVSGVFGAMAYNASSNKIQKVDLSANPTYAELVGMRGLVQAAGSYSDGTYGYIMSGGMAAILEATRRFDSGDTPILADGKIGGFPVLLTEYIEATGANTFNETPKHIGFGRWSDLLIGQFGEMKLTVDPYTKAKNGITNLILDTYFSVDMIRKDSFVIGTVKATS